ncbi:acyltransferase [Gordonia jinhuaensis]|uniref:Acyltransferase n=1 Tax=Gordonia jinhuaensis TaxID=1517702 RepID=A0A916TFH7_9ACTN|nr:acyltransferase [Gordonia jinhuaensis]
MSTGEAPKKKKKNHLYQLDFVRLITFSAVILDHVLMGVEPISSTLVGGIELLCRYSRYSFFALTGFVLTYQYRKRELRPIEFWRRRFKLIGLPYLVWSAFYWLYAKYRHGGFAEIRVNFDNLDHLRLSAKSFGYDLLTGTAWGHLYFLFVSMQIYLIFPLALIILKKTWGYHRYLLAVSFICQAAVMYYMVRPPADFLTHGLQGVIWMHLVCTLIPYQFFVLAGAIAAMHYEAFQPFMIRWKRQLIAGGLVVIVATLVYYVHKVNVGEDMFRATNVFMLHNVFAFIAIIVILYCLGTVWQSRRRDGSLAAKFMAKAADRSFGVYLVHAVVCNEILQPIDGQRAFSETLRSSILVYILVVAITVYIVEALRRSPISLITTGRNMVSWREQNLGRCLIGVAGGLAAGVIFRFGFDMVVGNLLIGAALLLLVSTILSTVNKHRDAEPLPKELKPELV